MALHIKLEKGAQVPTKGSQLSAGYDLYSYEDISIAPGERALISSGISLEIPEGCYGRIAPRSGLACKNSIDTGAGVIDRDYRGIVKVLLINNGKNFFVSPKGTRMAQLVLERYQSPEIKVVENLDSTERGEYGFGSTGLN